MNKGYQIIEPRSLHPLFTNSLYDIFSVAIMTWLCELLRLEFSDHLEHVEFDVICVTYAGSYPAIGIHYKSKNYQDISPLVELAIDRIFREKSALEFALFLTKSGIDWKEVATKIMSIK